jgi:hypothetical protein
MEASPMTDPWLWTQALQQSMHIANTVNLLEFGAYDEALKVSQVSSHIALSVLQPYEALVVHFL